MTYFSRKKSSHPAYQGRNLSLKAFLWLVIGASFSFLLANADLVINPQISNSIAYIKQFFVTSDGTNNGSVGVILQGSGVFATQYCDLSGSNCTTSTALSAMATQLAGLSSLYLTSGQVDAKINTFSGTMMTYLSGNYYDKTGVSLQLAGLSSLYLTGGQVDTKIDTFSGAMMTHLSGNYYTKNQVDAKGYLTSYTETDPIWIAASGNYYTKSQVDAKGYLTGGDVNSLAKTFSLNSCTNGQVAQYNTGTNTWQCATLSAGGGITMETDPIWVVASGNYYTKTQVDAKGYITGGQVTANETDPAFNSWLNAGPLSNFITYESDPKVGTLTDGKWCRASGTSNTIECDMDAPSGGGIGSESDPKVGTLTNNYIPRWNSSSSTLSNGSIMDDGIHVGIGTSPTTYKLTVGGGARFDIGESQNEFVIYNGPAGYDAINVDGENRNVLLNEKVGIGMAPSVQLDVNGTGKFSAGIRSPRYCNASGGNCFNSTTISNIPLNYVVKSSPSIYNKLDLYDPSASVGYTRIQSYVDDNGSQSVLSLNPEGGNVAIGTTNPGTAQLAVAGNTSLNGHLDVNGSSQFNIGESQNEFVIYNGPDDSVAFSVDGGNLKTYIGYPLGIGMTATRMLSVGGSASFLSASSMSALEILGNGSVPTRRGISLDSDPSGKFDFYINNNQTNASFNFKDGNTSNTLFSILPSGIAKVMTSIYTPQICDVNGSNCVTVSEIAGLAAAATPGQMPVNTATTAYALYNASTCSGANKGAMRFSSLNNRFEGCNGTQWVAFTTTNIAVEQPAVCGASQDTCSNGTPSGGSCSSTTRNWTCTAANGSSVSCSLANAPMCDPFTCGTANEAFFYTLNSSDPNLCVGGSATSFAYHPATNTWTWSCGSNSCWANESVDGMCDLSTEYSCAAGLEVDEDPACVGTTAKWHCEGINGGDMSPICSFSAAPTCGGACFVAGTPITLADGSQKAIEDITVGDTLVGMGDQTNTVQKLIKKLYTRKLYSINGSDYFVTDNHLFLTAEGWKAFDAEMGMIDHPGMIVGTLEIGDVLFTEEGPVQIVSLASRASSEYVYSFEADGNHTYYSHGYLVHNSSAGI